MSYCGHDKALTVNVEAVVDVIVYEFFPPLIPELVEEVVHVLLAVHGYHDSVKVLFRQNSGDLFFSRLNLNVDELLPLLKGLVELGVKAPGCDEQKYSTEVKYVIPVDALQK